MSRLRILVDYTFADSGGARTHAAEVTPRLAADPRLSVAIARRRDQPAGLAGAGVPTTVLAPAWTRIAALRVLWQQTALPACLRDLGIDVLFCPTDFAPLAAPCAVVLLVRNLVAWRAGALSGGVALAVRQWAMRCLTRLSARRADRTFFVSETSRREHDRWLRVPRGRSSVIHHGRGAGFVPGPAEGRAGILSVSSLYRFKNYLALCRAVRLLLDAGVDVPPVQVVGRILDRPAYAEIADYCRAAALDGRVVFGGEVAHPELPALYRRAQAFVLPSRLETFCHPVVEAMACATPTLVADTEVMREICGDGAAYFDPADPASLATALRRILADPVWAVELGRRGAARAQAFSWDETARRTAELLVAAAAGRTGKEPV